MIENGVNANCFSCKGVIVILYSFTLAMEAISFLETHVFLPFTRIERWHAIFKGENLVPSMFF